MSVRSLVRRFRLYYKPNTRQLFRHTFQNYRRAWWFPFFGDGTFIPRNGAPPIHVPPKRWSSLATAARLLQIGARPTWDAETLTIEWNDLVFAQPAAERWTPHILIEDPWHTKDQNLEGKIVVDIGAFIGDSSIAFALRGATVHAFEAVPVFARYAARNVKLNRLEHRVSVHAVGLSNRAETVSDLDQVRSIASMSHNCLPDDDTAEQVRLVDAIGYLRGAGIARADVIKMNCEGCEYQLLGDDRILRYLNPERVLVDYHYGSEALREVFSRCGYEVEDLNPGEEKGTLHATRRAAAFLDSKDQPKSVA